jgi:hypothetical protein
LKRADIVAFLVILLIAGYLWWRNRKRAPAGPDE